MPVCPRRDPFHQSLYTDSSTAMMSPLRNCSSPGSEGWKSNSARTRETVAAVVPDGCGCTGCAGCEEDAWLDSCGAFDLAADGAAPLDSRIDIASAIWSSSSSFWRSVSEICVFCGFEGARRFGFCDFSFIYAPAMMPRSGSRANISDHSAMRSRILALTCWCVLRSFANRSSASVKLLDASSLCICMPQFWLRALASSRV